MLRFACLLLTLSLWVPGVRAEVRPSFIFTHHMVLQRGLLAPVWGTAAAGEEVSVTFGEQTQKTTADEDGKWRVDLEPLAANAEPHELVVTGSESAEPVTVRDVLVGDVWVCSGQSNMQWSIDRAKDGDLTLLAADRPLIRLLHVNTMGAQEPVEEVDRAWTRCTADTLDSFSAVGYHFGSQLQQTLGVPIGLIRNAWGGSACEAWAPRPLLEQDPLYESYLDDWRRREAKQDEAPLRADYDAKMADFTKKRDAAYAAGKSLPKTPSVDNPLFQQHRPGNLYNARVLPLVPFAIKGVIWYQGESNSGRPETYDELFPLTIQAWRDAVGQGDFPFYWVQLADFHKEARAASEPSGWVELREAQTTSAERVPNGGQVVIIDIGESNDIHPRNKRDVGLRLARLALGETYGLPIKSRSATFESLAIDEGRAIVTLENVGDGLKTFDGVPPRGFAIAGEDRVFHDAAAKIVGKNQIELSADGVPEPVAVRYGWANNPVVNVYDSAWLPLTPFRTDDWPREPAGE